MVVAFSGGPDSLALLALLAGLPDELRPELEAVHVDHGLRPSSGTEAARALELASALGVPARSVQVAPEGKGGVEAAARRARYRALAEAAAGRPVLTAHTADDQAETVLLRLARGAGLHGAAGMRARSSVCGAHVVRPLLGVRRSELHRVVERLGLDPVRDPSNEELHFARNRVRAEVLPVLEAIAPGAAAALARFAAQAGEDERYLVRRVARILPAGADGVDATRLGRLPAALRGRVVRELVARAGGPVPSAARIAEVLALAGRGGELHLAGGIVATASGGRLRVAPGPTGRAARAGRAAATKPGPPPGAEVVLQVGESLSLLGVRFELERADALLPGDEAGRSAILLPEAEAPLRIRPVRAGERLRVPGVGSRLASDLLGEARVPREKRPRALVVEGAAGPIWLVGVRPLCRKPERGEPSLLLRASEG